MTISYSKDVTYASGAKLYSKVKYAQSLSYGDKVQELVRFTFDNILESYTFSGLILYIKEDGNWIQYKNSSILNLSESTETPLFCNLVGTWTGYQLNNQEAIVYLANRIDVGPETQTIVEYKITMLLTDSTTGNVFTAAIGSGGTITLIPEVQITESYADGILRIDPNTTINDKLFEVDITECELFEFSDLEITLNVGNLEFSTVTVADSSTVHSYYIAGIHTGKAASYVVYISVKTPYYTITKYLTVYITSSVSLTLNYSTTNPIFLTKGLSVDIDFGTLAYNNPEYINGEIVATNLPAGLSLSYTLTDTGSAIRLTGIPTTDGSGIGEVYANLPIAENNGDLYTTPKVTYSFNVGQATLLVVPDDYVFTTSSTTIRVISDSAFTVKQLYSTTGTYFDQSYAASLTETSVTIDTTIYGEIIVLQVSNTTHKIGTVVIKSTSYDSAEYINTLYSYYKINNKYILYTTNSTKGSILYITFDNIGDDYSSNVAILNDFQSIDNGFSIIGMLNNVEHNDDSLYFIFPIEYTAGSIISASNPLLAISPINNTYRADVVKTITTEESFLITDEFSRRDRSVCNIKAGNAIVNNPKKCIIEYKPIASKTPIATAKILVTGNEEIKNCSYYIIYPDNTEVPIYPINLFKVGGSVAYIHNLGVAANLSPMIVDLSFSYLVYSVGLKIEYNGNNYLSLDSVNILVGV